MPFTLVTVNGLYRTPGGGAAAGVVVFTPRFAMRNDDTIVAAPTSAVIGPAGAITVVLAATTDPGTAPLGCTYRVQEYIVGVVAVRSYDLAVPHTFPTLDLEAAPITEVVPPVAPFPTPGPPPTLELGTVTSVGPTGSADVDVVEIPTEYGGRYRLDFVLQQGPQGDPSVPIDGSVTNAKVATNAAIVADKLADGTGLKVLTAAERTKLAGVATGATANATDALLRDRTTHTGIQAQSTVTNLTADLTARLLTADAPELIRDTIGAALVAGANVTVTPNDAADTITVAATVPASISPTIVDVKGDLVAATAADVVARLPVGTSGQVLIPDAGTGTGLRWSSVAVPAPVVLTDAATVTVDAALGETFRLAALGNRTIAAPTNPVDGQTIAVEITAAGGAARTITLATGAAGSFAFGTTITALSATTSALTDIVEATYRASSARWWVRTYVKGFA